jgi:hypothetical protein
METAVDHIGASENRNCLETQEIPFLKFCGSAIWCHLASSGRQDRASPNIAYSFQKGSSGVI